jgi:hypothetical protein
MNMRESAVVTLILVGICAAGILVAYVVIHGPLR